MNSCNLGVLFTIINFSIFISFSIAAPALQRIRIRDNTIPPPPTDPPQTPGDGSGPWNVQKPGVGDYALFAKYRGVATAADIRGLHHASAHMTHYLDDTGKDLIVSPEDIMKDLPNFKAAVRALAQESAKSAYSKAVAASGSATFSSPWNLYGYAGGNFNDDWFYAMGAFSYSVSGVVTISQGKASIKYVIHVFDRYNWDKGKCTQIGPITICDEELGRLHTVGLAREYVIRGSSAIQKVDNYNPNVNLPPPKIDNNGRR